MFTGKGDHLIAIFTASVPPSSSDILETISLNILEIV